MLKKTIKLNMNEVPYLPPKEIIEAAKKGLKKMNRYSDPEDLEQLRGLLADYCGVPKKHIIPGTGSDLLLREAIHTLSKGRKIVMVNPSFLPTVQTAKQFATKLVSIRLSPPDFDLNVNLLLDQLAPGFIRVSIGTPYKNDAFIKGCRKFVRPNKKPGDGNSIHKPPRPIGMGI